MLEFPSRIAGLISRIEAGEVITTAEVKRIETLQALDIANAGEQFVREWAQRERERTEEFANE